MTNFIAPKSNPLLEIKDLQLDTKYVEYNNKNYSYNNFLNLVTQYKNFIGSLDLTNSDIISIISSNSIYYIAFVLACFETNTTVALINNKLTLNEIDFQLKQINSKHVISEKSIDLDSVSNFSLTETLDTNNSNLSYIADSWDSEKDACILFTTGSSGKPKVVVHSVNSLIASASASNKVTGFSLGQEWLVSLPFFHIAALQIFMRTLITGGRLRILEKHSASDIIIALEEKPADFLSAVPTQLEEIINTKGLSFVNNKLKTILLAGAPSSPTLQEQIKKLNTQILTCYGMTEVGSHISCLPRNSTPEKRTSVGKTIPNVVIELRDSNTGLRINSGNSGQIALKTPQLAKGYINPDGTREDFKEWFLTSDIGEYDQDGFLYIKGRVDNIFISGGENISTREIELCALNCQGVKDCAVIPVSDEKWGQRPVLFVVLENPTAKEALELKLKADLAKFKFPKEIIELKEIPRIGIGKVNYQELKNSVH